jgi:hypothetical protein
MTALLARGEVHARELIAGLIQECVEGISDREGEALALAQLWLLEESWVRESFAEARLVRGQRFILPKTQPSIEPGAAKVERAKAEPPVRRRKVLGDAELKADPRAALEALGLGASPGAEVHGSTVGSEQELKALS